MRNILDLHDIENERIMTTINSGYDLEKDADNRWCAMNAFTNGRWYETMSEDDYNILTQVEWLSREEGFKILLPYLDKKYQNKRKYIDEAVQKLKTNLDIQKYAIFGCMEKLTKHPILRNDFTIWFTTCKRCPYNWKTWEIWMSDSSRKEWRKRNRTYLFTHELLHMQTHKYYEKEYPMNKLNSQQFNLIKETLTFLLNHEFPWVDMATDKWYPQHQEYIKILEDYRLSCWDKRDFEDLINFWCKYILENNILSE